MEVELNQLESVMIRQANRLLELQSAMKAQETASVENLRILFLHLVNLLDTMSNEADKNKLETLLEEYNIKAVSPIFYDEKNCEIATNSSDPSKPNNTITKIVKKGYMLGDACLRKAVVNIITN